MAKKRSAIPGESPSDQAVVRDRGTGRFVKGVSGNPGGQRKTKPATDAIIAHVNESRGVELKLVVKALFDEAKSGNIQAIREIFDRYEGRVPLALQHSGDIGTPLEGEALDNRLEQLAVKLGFVRAK